MALKAPERISHSLAPVPLHYTMPSRPRHRESTKNSRSERKRTKNTAHHRESGRGATQRSSNTAAEMRQDVGGLSTHRPIDESRLSPYGHLSDPVSEGAYDSFSDYTTPGFGDDLSDIALSSMLSLDDNGNQPSALENHRSGHWSDRSSKDSSSSVGDSVMHPDTRLLSPAPTNPSVSRTSTFNVVAVEPTTLPPNQTSQLLSNAQYGGGGSPAFAQSSLGQSGVKRVDVQSDPSDPLQVRRGVDPVARNQIDEVSIPSLEDQQKERELATTKAGVERWLTTTNTSDEASPYASDVRDPSKETAIEHRSREGALSPNQTAQIVSSPGPGVYVNQDDDDEDDDEGDEEDENDDSDENDADNQDTTPPAPYMSKDAAPTPSDTSAAQTAAWAKRPWVDSPFESDSASLRGQPTSSNAAIARFARRAKDTETASVTATIASSFRRRSLESMFSAANISIVPPSEADSASIAPVPRRSSLLGKILPKRSPSKNRELERRQTTEERSSRKEIAPPRSPMKRVPSWARSKSPSISSLSIPPTPLSQQPRSATTLAPSSGPWTSVTNVIKRARSRSDLGVTSALAEQWASSGGPPVMNLRPPVQQDLEPEMGIDRHDSFESREGEVDAEGDGEHTPTAPVDMVMGPMEDLAAPTPECFRAHTLNANPRIEFFMLERVTSEQLKRYRRLVEALIKHKTQVEGKHCPSGDRCGELGSGPQMLDSRRVGVGAEPDFPAVTFYITQAAESESAAIEDDSIPATFPEGIPLPPAGVQRLPAEFECPLCFQVKKFLKPSDWTKHVHEDLQPFTCSFPDCGEPKSFKRKADWVRHENERHRQLEKWICNFPDCQHVCYRKDNFVQHLVREHKMPEPKMRASKAAVRAGAQDKSQVGQLIETCRYETTRRPDEEACRFCGNYLTSWKKLSAHLAKHMEHISLPVLSLVRLAELDQSAATSSDDSVHSYPRMDAPRTGSRQPRRQVTPIDTSFAGLEPGEQTISGHGQYYDQTPTTSAEAAYRGEGVYDVYAASRPGSHTYPGARNLPRQSSASSEQQVAQTVQFVDNQAYAQASPTSTYMSVFDEPVNIIPGSETHGPSMSYPPAFVTSTGPGQPNATYAHSPIYDVEQMYGQPFAGNEYNTQSHVMQQQQGYQYSQGAVPASAMQYAQRATSPYTPAPSSRKTSAQFSPMSAAQYGAPGQVPSHQYAQGTGPPYATGPTPFPQIQVHPYSEGHAQGQAGMQQQYLPRSPSEAAAGQGYLASGATFDEQASGAGQGSAQFPHQHQHQQQQQYGRYYR